MDGLGDLNMANKTKQNKTKQDKQTSLLPY
jgi:hypothetical protein